MAVFDVLTALAIVMLLGIIFTYFSSKLSIPNVLMLMAIGFVLSLFTIRGEKLIAFSAEFLEAIAIIALIMIVFDSTSHLRLKGLSKEASSAFSISLAVGLLTIVFVSLAVRPLFDWSWTSAILFSSIMVGTDAGSSLALLKGIKHKVIDLLSVESVVNTPFTVILPFVVIDIAQTFHVSSFLENSIEQITPFLQQIVTGVGAGIVVSLIVLRILRKQYSEILSPVTLISSALLTYILAESLGGSGVLAVTTLGIFFGNVYVQKKQTLATFGSLFSNLFEILVFTLLGLSLSLPSELIFYAKALLLFGIYLVLRGVATWLFLRKKYSTKELMFTALNSPKGVAVAVVLFTLLSQGVVERPLVDLSILFIIYSVIVSTFLVYFSKYFLGVEAVSK